LHSQSKKGCYFKGNSSLKKEDILSENIGPERQKFFESLETAANHENDNKVMLAQILIRI